jgi:hypothetical protein
MKLIKLLILLPILLVGCSTTTPVVRHFPDAPALLLEKCTPLETVADGDVSIIDFVKTVTNNYTTYYVCAANHDSWIDWYQKQKQIFESVK